MPHVNIKFFPVDLSQSAIRKFVESLTELVVATLVCDSSAVSIALEPIEQESWLEKVYKPDIIDRENILCKFPEYTMD